MYSVDETNELPDVTMEGDDFSEDIEANHESGHGENAFNKDDDQADTLEEEPKEKSFADLKEELAKSEEGRRKAEEWTRAIQSESDKKINDLQNKFIDFVRNTESQLQQIHSTDNNTDDPDEPLTKSSLDKLLEEREKKKSFSEKREQEDRERMESEYRQSSQEWLRGRKDFEDVNRFFQQSNLKDDPEFKGITETQGQFYYASFKKEQARVKSEIEKAYKRGIKDSKRGNIPPVGNTGQHFAGQFNNQANSLRSAFENYHKRKGFI